MEAAASQGDAAVKFALSRMSCGNIDDFHAGLRGRVGDAFLDFEKAMEAEHCRMDDSEASFITTNYKIRTCTHHEWQIVVQEGSIGVPHAGDIDMSHGRRIPNIDKLLKLPLTAAAKLSRAEVIAVVLYTGPLYEKYNCVLRRHPKEAYDDMVRKGSTFSTTIQVLVSAVQKLASVVKLSDGLKLYRGLGGVSDLPESFFKSHANGGRGFTEWGFMSTTSDKQIAIKYSSNGEARVSPPMVLELTVSAVDRGACIKDFSQYPHEVEYLWVPCSFVAPAPGHAARLEVTEKHGVVSIVPVQVNSNQSAPTIEQMLDFKKQTHMAAFRYGIQEIKRDLTRTSSLQGPKRYVTDFYKKFQGKDYTHEGLVENILAECKKKLETHGELGADEFAKDGTYRTLVTEMLNVKMMAESKLTLWLQDPSRCIMHLEDVSIKDAHQQLLGFLRKRMQHEGANARKLTVMQICKLKGLLDTSVDDSNGLKLWEERLMSAAAEGISSNDLNLLLEAGSVKSPGVSQALMKSAEFGHVHCIQVLVERKADIHFRDKDGVTPLCIAAQNGHAEAVRMLLQAKADVNAANKDGATALCIAGQNGHAEAVRMLLKAKADVNTANKFRFTPLYMAAQNGHAGAVRMLLVAKADVNAAENDGVTPLWIAGQNGHAKAVRMLLKAKADVKAAKNNGVTPLYMAAQNGHAKAVRMLLLAKADVNNTRSDGVTPLYMAAQNGHAKAVRMLLKAKADVKAASNTKRTALRQALLSGSKECMQLLIHSGSDVMVRDGMGETLLMLAVCKEDWESASSLFSVGGYELLSSQNCLGLTCLDMMPSGCKDDQGASSLVKLVQARDEQCDAFVRSTVLEARSEAAACLELYRGHKCAVSLKAETRVCAALFRQFATVRAGHCMCPSGSAAYYELQVVRMGECPQWGFCSDAFEQSNGYSGKGVGDDGSSWGVDGHRLSNWHNGRKGQSALGGRQWQDGDVIGLACDLRTERGVSDTCDQIQAESADGGSIWVSLNGDFSPPYGLVFHLPQGISGLFAAFSFETGAVRCNLGEEPLKGWPFKHAPPGEGFMPMCSFSKLL